MIVSYFKFQLISFTEVFSKFHTFLFLVFFILSIASWFWTISPYDTRRLIIPLLGLFILGTLVLNISISLCLGDLSRVQTAILIGTVLGFLILAIEIATPLAITSFLHKLVKGHNIIIDYTYSIFYKNGANISALILFPAAIILYQKYNKYMSFSLIYFALIILYFSEAGAALLAVSVGILAMGLTYQFKQSILRFFKFILIVFVLSFPLAISLVPSAGEIEDIFPNLPDSVYPRIFIWQASAKYILDNPILGKGFNTSRAISKPSDRVEYYTTGVSNRGSVPIPLHPHSAVMQIWLELGVFGIVLFLAFLLTTVKSIENGTSSIPKRAMAYGSFFSAFTIANTSYGIWQNWWISALWLTAIFTIISIRDQYSSTNSV
jgi:exopolysaccharide production protein ExoQ